MGCIAGALEEGEYRSLLHGAGFEEIEIEPTRIYGAMDAQAILGSAAVEIDDVAEDPDGSFMSAFVRARKPKRDARRPADAHRPQGTREA